MAKKISEKQITNIGKLEFRSRMAKESVEKCYKNDLFVPALCLVCCFIDGLGKGTTKDYLNNLKTHFPDLCKELGALTFYQKYRNGIVHEFCMKPGFGIDRELSMGSQYISERTIEETEDKLVSLNIDRLVNDFLKWVTNIRKKNKYKKV